MARSENMTVGPVILSHPHLFQAQSVNGGKPTYNVNILFPPEICEQIQAQVVALAQQAFPNGEYNQPTFKWPIHQTSEKPEKYGDLPGWFFANIKASGDVAGGHDYPPQVVDANHQPIIDPGQIKAGNECYVSINVYSYSNAGKGISIGVSAVLKWAEGTPRKEGGAVNVQTVFANVPTAPPPGAQAPQMSGTVPQQQVVPQQVPQQQAPVQTAGVAQQQPPMQQPPAGMGIAQTASAGMAPAGVHPTTGQPIPPVTGTPQQF